MDAYEKVIESIKSGKTPKLNTNMSEEKLEALQQEYRNDLAYMFFSE